LIRPEFVRPNFARKATPLLAASLFALIVATTPSVLSAQSETPETPLVKQLHKLDLGVSGVGIYNTTVTGPIIPTQAPDYGTIVTQYGSNTAGALATLRYIAKPYFGLEFNYGYARYTENYSVAPGQIQTKVNEYTFGTQAFKPTPHGGQGAPEKARATYYYTLGVQKELGQNGHFGIRAGFRELFFLDPDFGQNYLTILKHANTYEPQAGFYLRY
jgi:hypothetical protein